MSLRAVVETSERRVKYHILAAVSHVRWISHVLTKLRHWFILPEILYKTYGNNYALVW